MVEVGNKVLSNPMAAVYVLLHPGLRSASGQESEADPPRDTHSSQLAQRLCEAEPPIEAAHHKHDPEQAQHVASGEQRIHEEYATAHNRRCQTPSLQA